MQRIGIDLIARASQITAAIIAAEIVSIGADRAAVIEDVFARRAGIQDYVGDLNDTVTKYAPLVMNASARRCRVAGDRATCHVERVGELIDTAPLVPAELPLMVLFTISVATP
jgi:hypothetical protein